VSHFIQHADPGFVRMLIGTNCHRENSRVVPREAALQVQIAYVYVFSNIWVYRFKQS